MVGRKEFLRYKEIGKNDVSSQSNEYCRIELLGKGSRRKRVVEER